MKCPNEAIPTAGIPFSQIDDGKVVEVNTETADGRLDAELSRADLDGLQQSSL